MGAAVGAQTKAPTPKATVVDEDMDNKFVILLKSKIREEDEVSVFKE